MVRFGILGAARIVPWALLEPAARRSDVEIVAIAARRPGAAASFAARHGITIAYESYEDLIADPAIDVIYNPLPPHLHAEFSIKALEAGKHVLCEKPFAMNAREAEAMQTAATRAGRRVVEAFHDHYHPVFQHLLDLVDSSRLGAIRALTAVFNHTVPHTPGEFRRIPSIGGGALMDLGCYPVHWCRSLMQAEPEVTTASATLTENGCDEEIRATLTFPSGTTARIEALMTPDWRYHARFVIEGERGTVTAENSLLPHLGHSIIAQLDGAMRQYTIGGGTTFDFQLEAFLAALADGTPLPTEGADSLGNMRTIDAIYAKAGVNRERLGL
jgi:predicted dehydrogenase